MCQVKVGQVPTSQRLVSAFCYVSWTPSLNVSVASPIVDIFNRDTWEWVSLRVAIPQLEISLFKGGKGLGVLFNNGHLQLFQWDLYNCYSLNSQKLACCYLNQISHSLVAD